jgi:V/A-type H+-transporting ATPase subunit I
MKKVTVVSLETNRDSMLRALRELGILHLLPVQQAGGDALEALRLHHHRVETAAQIVATYSRTMGAPHPHPHTDLPPDALATRIHEQTAERKALSERMDGLVRERDRIEPFGDFDPALALRLREQGVPVRLFAMSTPSLPPPLPANAVIRVTRSDRNGTYWVAIGDGPVPAEAQECELPSRRLTALCDEIAETQKELHRIDRELTDLSAGLAALHQQEANLSCQIRFIEAREGMASKGSLAAVQGYCPVTGLTALEQAAHDHGWGLVVNDPEPGEAVPTFIRNPVWIRPIECLFKMIKILPGYHEVDVSGSFLFFLSIFFAMIVGDAGYGLIFLLLTGYARWKAPSAPREPFVLMTIFSVCTIVWGVLSGAYFGIESLPRFMQPLASLPSVAWIANQSNIMNLCLLIGASHLTLAHAWNVLRMINDRRALAQVGWIGVVWTMFFVSRWMMFGAPLPAWWMGLTIPSVILILLFMTPPAKLKEEWINHAMLPLSFMSAFGDGLSYLRLYALSVAGFKVAASFNLLALNIGFDSVFSGLMAALILFFAHALNVALSAMSVLVHGIRLNALEFSMHLGLEWSGSEYKPFSLEQRG